MGETSQRRYQTRQRECVLACLESAPDEFLTAREVARRLASQGSEVGTATIYRALDRLVADGLATKSTVDGADGACYRLLCPEERPEASCYLMCEHCGRITAIACHELADFYEHFSREHHVRIDPVKTILYGTCADCLESR